jgi:lipopolysaccharide/colanic/teichoic acid biosynthesis glycosyltransferase
VAGHNCYLRLAFDQDLIESQQELKSLVPEMRRQAPAVRGIPQPQLSRRLQEEGVSSQIGRPGDFVVACLLLAITAPLMAIAALLIKLDSAGPVLERRESIARGGRRFQMLKFRTTMHGPRHAKPTWARPTTPLGEFLRYTRIEDLPQLINVLRGEMSIIHRDAG